MIDLERQVSVWRLAAWVTWGLVVACLVAGTIVGLAADLRHLVIAGALFAHGLALSAAAATMSIRNVIVKRDQLLRDAFDVGRDSDKLRRVR